jgi:DNA ligase-1
MEYHTGLYTLGRENGIQVVNAPDFFLDNLPVGIPLHGELWYNDRTDLIQSLTGSDGNSNPLWRLAQFIVLFVKPYSTWVDEYHEDVMSSISEENPFRLNDKSIGEMIDIVSDLLSNFSNDINFIKRTPVDIHESVESYNKTIQDNMWEGLMFLNPSAKYENKRSYFNCKLKPFYETEAEVIGWEKGKSGKFLGGYSGLKVKMTWDNKILSVYGGTEPMVGTKVTFVISGGIPDYLRLPSGWSAMQEMYPKGKIVNFSYYGVYPTSVPKSCSLTVN